jgi:hypothetical protein
MRSGRSAVSDAKTKASTTSVPQPATRTSMRTLGPSPSSPAAAPRSASRPVISTGDPPFREAGFSTDVTHHAMHALGSRALGFTQELWDDKQVPAGREELAILIQQTAAEYPNTSAMLKEITHDADTTLGWCDDQVEFEFALDLILDGLERLRNTS